jgi:membrane protein implicated in regulation of membrane protease activity
MDCNIGKIDRIIRLVIGVALLLLAFLLQSVLLGIVGLVVLVTGVIKFCLLYKLLDINTCLKD